MLSIEKLDSARIKQEKIPYTMHHNYVLQNVKDLTALGIWCYLTSLPDDWRVHRTHLMSHFGIGRDKLAKALKFLNDNKLLEYVQERDEHGVFGDAYIKIRCGYDFEQHHKKLSTEQVTAPLKTRTTENPCNGKTAPTKEINNYKRKKEKQRDFVKNEKTEMRSTVKPYIPPKEKPQAKSETVLEAYASMPRNLQPKRVRDLIGETFANGSVGLHCLNNN